MSSGDSKGDSSFALGREWLARVNQAEAATTIQLKPESRHLQFEFDVSQYEVDKREMKKRLKLALSDMLAVLHKEHIEPSLLHTSRHRRWTVYDGSAGVAYTLFKVRQSGAVESPVTMQEIRHISSSAVKSSDPEDATLLTGHFGALAVECLINDGNGVDVVVEKMEAHWENEGVEQEEVLYGKAGFLQVLLLLRQIDPGNSKITKLAQKVIQHYFDREDCFLTGELQDVYNYFQWHNKCYFGAAHGIAGVIYTILSFGKDVVGESKWKLLIDLANELIRANLMESGNMPSSITSEKDRLVHWCHGSPGFLLLASKFELDEFTKPLQESVWRRGLLHTKGPGLCHGIAGNGYCLLSLYGKTHDQTQLKRALFYADVLSRSWKEMLQYADRPYSLYTGVCGAILYITDCIRALNGETGLHFPCYEY